MDFGDPTDILGRMQSKRPRDQRSSPDVPKVQGANLRQSEPMIVRDLFFLFTIMTLFTFHIK